MNDRQLRSFLLACKARSFSKAAEEALISKPAFVQQINLLEREAGFPLFVRTSRGVTPTAEGAELARAASEALGLLDECLARCREASRRRGVTVRVGYDPAEMAPFMGEVCSRLRTGSPDVEVVFVECPFAGQLQGVSEGRFDVCFFADSPLLAEMGLKFDMLYSEGQCCCMSPADPLAGKSLVEPSDLAGRKLYIEQIYTHETQTLALLEWLRAHDARAEIDGRPFDSSLPAQILMDGGILPVPRRYIGDCVPPLKAVPLDWPPSAFGAVRRPRPGEGVSRFIEAARGYFGEQAGGAGGVRNDTR